MLNHRPFDYTDVAEVKRDLEELGLSLPISDTLDCLTAPLSIKDKTIMNRMMIQPLEGFDANPDGTPSELTLRRYTRFAKGGAGVIWVESYAVRKDGKSNPRQLFISSENLNEFKKFTDMIRSSYEGEGSPYIVLQITHSGRSSRPNGKPEPIVAFDNPYIPKPDCRTITDEELEELENDFVNNALLAKEGGFDAVDIKACHGYIINELLAAHLREGIYGGSFENRVRFIINIIDKIRKSVDIEIAVRMNAYDAIPYPYGWGVDKSDSKKIDLTEPKKLVQMLVERGVSLINISCANGGYTPHIVRPYDKGPYIPDEHQLAGVFRMLNISREIQQSFPDAIIAASGLSWLREFAPYIAAGCISAGWFKIAGFGRQALAYPDFPKDIIHNGGMKREKCCITCGKCNELLKMDTNAGCVVKDSKVYGQIFNEARRNITKE